VDAAKALGFDLVVDLPGGMPQVDPNADRMGVWAQARDIVTAACAHATELAGDDDPIIAEFGFAVQGEATLSFHLVQRLHADGYRAFAATTDRRAVEVVNADGTVTKTSVFAFCQWRSY